MRYTYVVVRHPFTQLIGMVLYGHLNFDPSGGTTVAHNALEHFPDDDQSESDEFRAFGAALFVRLEGGWWSIGGNEEAVAVDQMVNWFAPSLVRIYSSVLVLHQPAAEDIDVPPNIERAVDEMMALVSSRLPEWINVARLYDQIAERQMALQRALKVIPLWLKLGYVQATERFYGMSPTNVCSMFRQIDREANEVLQEHPSRILGRVFEVVFDHRYSSVRTSLRSSTECTTTNQPIQALNLDSQRR